MKKIFTIFSLSFLLMMGMVSGQTSLWGTCELGGTNTWGSIFTSDDNGNNLHFVYSLVNASGALPLGAMVLANAPGKFYGVTVEGGCVDSCVIYTFDPCTGIFVDIHDFGCDSQHGASSLSGMTLAMDGKLYGLCGEGGANGNGVIYRVDPITNSYTDLFDFNDTSGSTPFGTLTQLSNGNLYGMTNAGGINHGGVIFSFDPTNSNYSFLYSFDTVTGIAPYYGGLLEATNGKLYGMTQLGGASGFGVIFCFDTSTNIYTDVHDFDNTQGKYPYGSLIQASNGLLYGMTNQGGIHNAGVIFSFDITTNSFLDLMDFNDTLGANPQRSFKQASNGLLFGTTVGGGINEDGVFFSFNISTNTDSVLFSFDGSNGDYPNCDIIEVNISCDETGINLIPNKESITIYPNPTSGIFTLSYNSHLSIQNSQLKIYDVLGQEVY